MSCVGRACNNAATSPVSVMPASWEVVCRWAHHPVISTTSGFSNTITQQLRLTTTGIVNAVRTHENCMHAEQIIIIFYIFYFIFCSMCLVLFSIVLYRTIVTVYTNNIFLYNYLQQMNQIIHLSPLACFTPARCKTVQQKSRGKRGYGLVSNERETLIPSRPLMVTGWL